MERPRIGHIAIGFAAARAWEIEQELAMTPEERQAAAGELKRRVYGTDAPDVREAERLASLPPPRIVGRMDAQLPPPGYRTQSPDTTYEAEQIRFAAYRRMTPGERIRRACDLAEAGRRLALAELRRRFPDASDRELHLRLASWYIPPEDTKAAFGWCPVEGRGDDPGPHPHP